MVAWINVWKLLSVSHHLAKFGGHCSSSRGCIKDLIFHVTLPNHVIERLQNHVLNQLYEWAVIIVCHNHAKFGGDSYYCGKDIMVSVCHVILQGHVIKEPCDFMDRIFSRLVQSYQVWWP